MTAKGAREMDFERMSREELIRQAEALKTQNETLSRRLESLGRLNHQLLREKEQEAALDFAWSGNLGHWYWDIRTNTVTFNPLKVKTLGYDMLELPNEVPYQFFTELLHPDDYPVAMDAMRSHLEGRASVYEVEYRIRAKDGSYHWYYDRGKITSSDENGHPVFLAGIVFDVTEKKRKQEELEQQNQILSEQAMMDGLTRVRNHRALMERLRTEIALAERSKSDLSIALFDLDDFKRVNDTKGHLFGDKVLADFASIAENAIRASDVFGRYGGEEFLLILPSTNRTTGFQIAERIRKLVEGYHFFGGLHITVSAGLHQYEREGVEELIRCADEKLYRAKGTGKNRVV